MSDVDPILVAGDDGEILDATDDGAVVCVEESGGLAVHLDPESELGERLRWLAGHRGESPETLLADAIRERADEARADGGLTVRCPNGHEVGRESAAASTFDGDEAYWRCPECGEWVEGPPPG